MEQYNGYQNNQRRPVIINLPLLTIILLIAGLSFWFFYSNRGYQYDPDAAPRAITPRGSLTEMEQTNIALFENASPSVVFITTIVSKRNMFSWDVFKIPKGAGSGFVWDREGHIVTNLHVVEDALNGNVELKVRFADQTEYNAFIIGGDRTNDVAVLHIDAPPEQLVPISIGTSNDLRVGQMVYAIGNPFGFDHTLTTGVVSALGREVMIEGKRKVSGLIQIDASINPGNSGGPLLDSASRLIGMNMAIYSPTGTSLGIGFAVPVDKVNLIVPQILQFGRTGRAGLGVISFPEHIRKNIAEKSPEFKRGFIIREVVRGSAAEAAGLRSARILRGDYLAGADIIIGVDNHDIDKEEDLTRVLGNYKPGDKVQLRFVRDKKDYETKVTLQVVE